MSPTDYAGFWLRFVAFVIDSIVLSVVHLLLVIPLFSFFKPANNSYWLQVDVDDASFFTELSCYIGMINLSHLIIILLAVVYFTVMESSRYQASIGKLAMELKVMAEGEAGVNFSKALVRNVMKMISAFILFLGFIVIFFTRKKQALHDLIAKTIVIKK